MSFKVGIDAGSTTVKIVLLNDENKLIYKSYKRHSLKIREVLKEELLKIQSLVEERSFKIAISGSAGYGISKTCKVPFVQEVFATTLCVKKTLSDIDVVIELGGEDAKIIFITGGLEERMNSSCAGGTGSFIDQMATLIDVTVEELDEMSIISENTYPIASRCGVFAKSDIQPLLNQGAKKEDVAASIYSAIVNQTIGGLAQGRKIEGNILFLGGPLYFYKGLRSRFIKDLKLEEGQGILPENAEVFVAIGTALYCEDSKEECNLNYLLNKLELKNTSKFNDKINPLFKTKEDYNYFKERHDKAIVSNLDISCYSGNAYLGIDAGSTTTKLVLVDENNNILYKYYSSNKGNPVEVVREELEELYKTCNKRINIKSSSVTGYGEELIKTAFRIDYGIVETVAHFIAAKHFNPKVDFILDIGGQDIKCFKIDNNIVTSIMLNEACSSGCGSFIESFANQMGYEVDKFSKLGLFAEHPVDLGSRCTVFMNSSVKQAQKDGSTIKDISAGLSMSVVKNALYKVIRAKDTEALGKNIVVQGGTMCNDAILRSLEIELGLNVIRSNVSGLMGAYGAALYAKNNSREITTLIDIESLNRFKHKSKFVRCGLCTNKCNLTINTFGEKSKYISGNRCERPEGKGVKKVFPNIYEYKYSKIRSLSYEYGTRGTVGIPVVLNMFENLPFWYEFFKELNISIVLSDESSKKLYYKGQYTIPSDTVCYPAKIAHGHVENLLEKKIENIFYPCMSYNFDEGISDNCFNCPIVAYYPEVLEANNKKIEEINLIKPYINFNNKIKLINTLYRSLKDTFKDLKKSEVRKAVEKSFIYYEKYKLDIKRKGKEAIRYANEHNLLTIVLAGRPYHIDNEINHGIDKIINALDIVIITEDSIEFDFNRPKVNILNQWTFQARLFNAANYVANNKNIELIQLISFGCGTDAVISDEIKSILEDKKKIYTQIKIDETNNLGAAKIRIRSMVEALNSRRKYDEIL